jgi:tetracycline repressor-like protein
LLAAATDHIIAQVLVEIHEGNEPQETIRAIALGVFDAIDRHPWVGALLSRRPLQHAVLRILEGVGAQVGRLGVPGHAQFNTATALLSLILGLAGQYAAGSERFSAGMDRTAFLESVAARWAKLDPDRYPFVRSVAAQLPGHDDREQFLAGIDLILAGIETTQCS